jgi:hypothetical protein
MKLVLALLIFAQAALAAPSRVIVIRHGEKPDNGPELNERGVQRAKALVGLFEGDSTITPQAIYAMEPKGPGGSVRAIQTVQPLADSLGLEIRQQYKQKELSALASDILGDKTLDGKTVLVCWEHKVIPDLIKALGYDAGPSKWPGGQVYDRLWILDFKSGKPASFKDLPQNLLPGDSDK